MNRLIVVSNRLPFALDSTGEDLWTVTPAAGGLVSAVEPVLRERGGTWIGWPGTAGEIPKTPLAEATRDAGYKVVPVALSEIERDEFYYGYSNEVIWPLFHDLQNFCNFEPGYWQTYKAVNDRFADVIARCAQPNDFIWVHDYHLMYVGQALRERGVSQKLSGFSCFSSTSRSRRMTSFRSFRNNSGYYARSFNSICLGSRHGATFATFSVC